MNRIGITLGDPAGIGPELTAQLVRTFKDDNQYFIYGEPEVFEKALRLLGISCSFETIDSPEKAESSGIYVVEVKGKGNLYQPSIQSGRMAVASLARATADAITDMLDGILTMPINKYWARKAGFSFPGQTEYLARSANTEDYAMLMYSEKIKVIPLSTHLPLRDAVELVRKERIVKVGKIAHREFERFFGIKPTIGVLGLNPHAGEGGEFGTEEIKEILPAVEELKDEGIKAEGPLSPDTAFTKPEAYDLFLCMYHDQALIPFKIYAFSEGVNMTIGIPFPRTSPDHGTAYDIAWKGIANPGSAMKALELLERVVQNLKK